MTSLAKQITDAKSAQLLIASKNRQTREALLVAYGDALKKNREALAKTLADDAKKTFKDAMSEVDASIAIIGTAITNTTLPDLGEMARERMRAPVGVVGLITSYNFPMVVAHWNIAPALLAGNAVLWKPSEKTPAAAHACKKIFDSVAGELANCLQIVDGNREVGAKLVADEGVDMISATGSVGMGEAIKAALAKKKNNDVPPILELGGNNAVVIGEAMSDEHLAFALASIMTSFLGTTGQRCTNTRRLFVHEKWLDKTIAGLEKIVGDFLHSGAAKQPDNPYGYNVLIDEGARTQFNNAKEIAKREGGKLLFGGAGEPAIAIMPAQTECMHHETFAPLLYVVPYRGHLGAAMEMVNAPSNAGLVNGLYTLSKKEAEIFAQLNQAGHSVINSPKGTGTPAFGMGFGGNKSSGSGEILWSGDMLAAFTRPDVIRRVAVNKNVPLS